MRVVADLLPKQASVKVGTDPLDEVSDDELTFIVEQLLAKYGDPDKQRLIERIVPRILVHPHRHDEGQG
jgi:hypothetical protein